MHGLAAVAFAEVLLPPCQQGETFLGVARFVGQVVGPAAIGIDVAKVLPEPPGQQPAGHRKVLVVPPGKSATVLPRLPARHRRGRGGLRAEAFQVAEKVEVMAGEYVLLQIANIKLQIANWTNAIQFVV